MKYTLLKIQIIGVKRTRSMAEIAEEIGVSAATVARKFANSDNGTIMIGDYYAVKDIKPTKDGKKVSHEDV